MCDVYETDKGLHDFLEKDMVPLLISSLAGCEDEKELVSAIEGFKGNLCQR